MKPVLKETATVFWTYINVHNVHHGSYTFDICFGGVWMVSWYYFTQPTSVKKSFVPCMNWIITTKWVLIKFHMKYMLHSDYGLQNMTSTCKTSWFPWQPFPLYVLHLVAVLWTTAYFYEKTEFPFHLVLFIDIGGVLTKNFCNSYHFEAPCMKIAVMPSCFKTFQISSIVFPFRVFHQFGFWNFLSPQCLFLLHISVPYLIK